MTSIRLYRTEDCPVLADIFLRAVREIAAKDYSPEQMATWAPATHDMKKFATRRAAKPTFVALHDGRIAGFTDLEADGHIDMLYVSRDFQRMGVAGALLDFVIARGRALNLSRLYSQVSITARPAFDSRGFSVIAAQMVAVNGVDFRNYGMEKKL
jgi:putative acetyltransferase